MFSAAHFLYCHERTSASFVQSVEAAAAFQEDGSLLFAYRLRGDIARLFIATGQAGAQKEGLWEQTCFEAFIRWRGHAAYREFNFSPAGEWATYDFSAYRQRVGGDAGNKEAGNKEEKEDEEPLIRLPITPPIQPIQPLSAPKITTQLTEGRLELCALIAPDDAFFAAPPAKTAEKANNNPGAPVLEIALSAVVETAGTADAHSYWALRHPSERPDFHHPDSFVFTLTAGFA